MPFRALFVAPVVALLAVLGIWYQQRPDLPSPVGAAVGTVVYLEGEVDEISRWESEPNAAGYWAGGFDEVFIRIERAETLDPAQGFLGLYKPDGGALIRMTDADLDVGRRYGFYLFVPNPEDQTPLWIRYVHDIERDEPARAFVDVSSSSGQTASAVLDCLVVRYRAAGLDFDRMSAMKEAIIDANIRGGSPQLEACEAGD